MTIAMAAVVALAGCSAPVQQPSPSGSQFSGSSSAEADDAGFGVYELETPEGTVYTLDLSESYSNELTKTTDEATFKAIDLPEDEQENWEWFNFFIDNTNGTEPTSYTNYEISIVTSDGETAYVNVNDVSITFGDLVQEYQDSLSVNDDIDEYNHYIGIYNEWLEVEDKSDTKPGAKYDQPVWLLGVPEYIQSVWFGDLEMTRK